MMFTFCACAHVEEKSSATVQAMEVILSNEPITIPKDAIQSIYPFQTTDQNNFSALLGKASLPTLQKTGHISIYKPELKLQGLVIITPGSEGIRNKMMGEHIRHFLSMSYAVAVVNSYAIRGRSNVLHNQAAVSLPSQVLDMILAMKKLQTIKEFSTLPIGIFSTSRGGMVVSLVLDQRLLKAMHIRSPAWACVLYPAAELHYEFRSIKPTKLPFLYVVAESDDEVSPKKAIYYSEVVHKKNPALRLVVWPHAVHLFDAPFPKIWLREALSSLLAPNVDITPEGLFVIKGKTLSTWNEVVHTLNTYSSHGIHIGHTDESNKKIMLVIKQFLKEIRS